MNIKEDEMLELLGIVYIGCGWYFLGMHVAYPAFNYLVDSGVSEILVFILSAPFGLALMVGAFASIYRVLGLDPSLRAKIREDLIKGEEDIM